MTVLRPLWAYGGARGSWMRLFSLAVVRQLWWLPPPALLIQPIQDVQGITWSTFGVMLGTHTVAYRCFATAHLLPSAWLQGTVLHDSHHLIFISMQPKILVLIFNRGPSDPCLCTPFVLELSRQMHHLQQTIET